MSPCLPLEAQLTVRRYRSKQELAEGLNKAIGEMMNLQIQSQAEAPAVSSATLQNDITCRQVPAAANHIFLLN